MTSVEKSVNIFEFVGNDGPSWWAARKERKTDPGRDGTREVRMFDYVICWAAILFIFSFCFYDRTEVDVSREKERHHGQR